MPAINLTEQQIEIIKRLKTRKVSSRHHYLPIFFINGFTNSNGSLWLFDKAKGRIINKPQFPKQVFFEWNRNTIDWGGIKEDMLEFHLQKVESKISKVFKKIQNSNSLNEILNNESLRAIQEFTFHKLFALPSNRDKLPGLRKEVFNRKLPDRAINYLRKVIENPFTNEENKQKTIDLILPYFEGMTFENNDLESKAYWNIELKQYEPTFILSDSPFIYKFEPKKFIDIKNLYIFPLTYNKIFLSHENYEYTILNEDQVKNINFLLMLQAKQFVASGDRLFLEECVEAYKILKTHAKVHEIVRREELFNFINRKI